MRIERLELQNFRLFADKQFNFPARFTVLIGENGRGKSAVLHGLRVAAGAWLLGFRETERLHIELEDVRRKELENRFAPQFPAIVRAAGIVENQTVEWSQQKADFKSGMSRASRIHAKQLVALAEQCDRVTNDELREVALPVLVFFSTARLWVGAKKSVDLKTKGLKIQDGYSQALSPEHKRTGAPGRAVALGWIKKAYFQKLEGRGWGGGIIRLTHPDTPAIAPVLLEAVFWAITACLPDWTDLRWDLENDDLTGLYHRPDSPPERVPLYYLSDGLRTMAGMVAEIAYRCVTLNGHLGADAVKESRGLVLIDELDMHLHPNWQRHVVADLKKAFPNLQFVVTTHSPFIVQSLDSTELINLDHPSDVQPKDLRLEDVATEVMNVESPLSMEGQQAEQLAREYLERLHTADQATSAELTMLENAVADPGLRAILRMERLLKEAKSQS
jgi:predicted ATP-binding protein involved in virulence